MADTKHMAEELRQSEARLRQVIDLVPHFIFAKDNEGRFILVNESVAKAYGTTVANLLGKTDADFNPNEDEVRHFREDDLKVIESGTAKFIPEEKITDVEGNVRYLQTVKIPYLLSGTRNPAILGVAVDITERKLAEEEKLRLENELQAARKLESLGVLAGGIAHDFNNLLVGILGNARMALQELASDSPACKLLDDVVTASRRASELCTEMLAYAGRGTFEIESIELSAMVDETSRLLDSYISKRTVIRRRLATDLPPIKGDPTQVRQVVMNLITNASDALGDEGGVITLTTGFEVCDQVCLANITYCSNLPEGNCIYLEVADNGCGMSEEVMDKLFDPFFTTKFTGRGLGLSAVLGIVRAHRGAMDIESEEGKGTRFKVFFPTTTALDRPSVDPSPVENHVAGGSILVIDDEPVVRELIRKVLEKAGNSVLTAGGGEDGLDIFDRHHQKIAAVILDMTMPQMDGLEVLKRLRVIDPQVRVVLCSGYNETEAIRTFAGKGVATFLHKPFEPAELLAKLQSLA